jgi:DNA-binding NtrC family response regulator
MDATIAGKFRVKITGGTVTHKATGASIAIDDEVTRLVGRGESCHLRLNDRLVSTAHCEIVATERGVLVRDLASRNGTRINEVLLGPHQHVLLTRPATLKVGDSELEFTPKKTAERELVGKFGVFESRSAKMGMVFDRLQKLAMMSASAHITGETGTGKTFYARAIHNQSARASKPFQVIDCAAIPPTLAEAELFGYEKGAFTGATGSKESPFVEADGGTVFLDEIGDLSLDVQARLLRVVDEREVKSVGQNRYRKVDVRILSATKHNLAARVNSGLFRDDLYSRLTGAHVEIPPLRERREDIEILIQSLLVDLGRPTLFEDIPREKLDWLKERPWTGNVRQLRQVMTNLADLTRHGGQLDVATAVDMAYSFGPSESAHAAEPASSQTIQDVLTARGTSLAAAREQADRIVLEGLHRETNGNISEIARRADVTRGFARSLLEKYGIREREEPSKKKGARP